MGTLSAALKSGDISAAQKAFETLQQATPAAQQQSKAGMAASSSAQSQAISASQEALETLDQTKMEAAKGDLQAISKLARINSKNRPQPAVVTATAPPAGGARVLQTFA